MRVSFLSQRKLLRSFYLFIFDCRDSQVVRDWLGFDEDDQDDAIQFFMESGCYLDEHGLVRAVCLCFVVSMMYLSAVGGGSRCKSV
jgi:hypothetical protein